MDPNSYPDIGLNVDDPIVPLLGLHQSFLYLLCWENWSTTYIYTYMLPTKYMRLNYCCKTDYKVKKCVAETHTKGIVYNGDKLIDNNGRFRCVDGPFFHLVVNPFLTTLYCLPFASCKRMPWKKKIACEKFSTEKRGSLDTWVGRRLEYLLLQYSLHKVE